MPLSFVPIAPIATTAAIATNPAIRAYSIAVTPDLSLITSERCARIRVPPARELVFPGPTARMDRTHRRWRRTAGQRSTTCLGLSSAAEHRRRGRVCQSGGRVHPRLDRGVDAGEDSVKRPAESADDRDDGNRDQRRNHPVLDRGDPG